MTDTNVASAPAATGSPPSAPAPDPKRAEMRDILALVSTGLFACAMAAKYALAWSGTHLDQTIATQLNQFDTAALVQWAGVMGYYFGSSQDKSK